MLLSRLLFTLLPLILVAAQDEDPGRRGRGDDDDGRHGGDNGDTPSTTVSSQSTGTSALASTSTTTPASQGTLTGDTKCSQTMCIAATVNGSETTYVLTGLGKANFGWMAMGFGSFMANSPMVIMWQNNGNIILSQRKAPSEVMPTVDPNPPRVAAALQAQSTLSTTKPSLAFTVPSNSDTSQPIIFAYGTVDPDSASESVPLQQHLDMGTFTLNLANVLSSGNSTGGGSSAGAPTTVDGTLGNLIIPLAPYEKLIVAHAIFCTVGFLLLLPAGVLLARYLRTFIGNWFTGHWIVQFGLAGAVIVTGIALGISSVNEAHSLHFDDTHKKWGIGLFVLYLVQCGLGAIIHFIKKADRKRRPPQNYLHAVLGLAIIALALYQVHSGFDTEWTKSTGREPLPSSVKIVFWVWVGVLPVSYGAGLAFLPKQWRQERAKVVNTRDAQNEYEFITRQPSPQYQKAVQ